MNLTGRELTKQSDARRKIRHVQVQAWFDSATERVIVSAQIKNCQELLFVF